MAICVGSNKNWYTKKAHQSNKQASRLTYWSLTLFIYTGRYRTTKCNKAKYPRDYILIRQEHCTQVLRSTVLCCSFDMRVFSKCTRMAIMLILAAEVLLRENKKIQWEMVPTVGIEPGPLITSDSKSNTILSGLTWHLLLRRSLNFCLCTTWFLDLEELRGFSCNQ